MAKLLTVKDFSEHSLMSTMRAAWSTAREVTFRPIGKNLFIVQAFCLGDWKRIMEKGPWLFRGCALMLEEFDGSSVVPPVTPCWVQARIQIHKIPPLYRAEVISRQLAMKVGEVIMVEMRAVSTSRGDFHRARVKLDTEKPLARIVTLTLEGGKSIVMQVKYEKIPRICSHCGKMGHNHLECGTGEHDEGALQYGDWMMAESETWRPGTPRFRAEYADRETS